MSSSEPSEANAKVTCPCCGKDLSDWGLAARTAHTESCMERGSLRSSPEPVSWRRVEKQSDVELSQYADTFRRLTDCPVCGKAWLIRDTSRISHVQQCAARYGMSASDLYKLIDIFKDSLDSSSGISLPPPIEPRPAPTRKPQTIDQWVSRHAEPSQSTAEPPSPSPRRIAGSFTYEIPGDDDFQSTRVTVPKRQSQISTKRITKKQQEFLDELDEDLNAAKALSLSLKRSRPGSSQLEDSAKKRGSKSKRAAMMERSDILACSDAQGYIRERAAALAYMDEELGIVPPKPAESPRETTSHNAGELWSLAASMTSDHEDCPIFKAYNMRHLHHASVEDCIGAMIENLLVLRATLHINRPNRRDITEESLQEAYVQILSMAREGFERQKSALQCAKWVDSSMEEQPESVIVLSSQSASSSDAGQQPSDDQPELLAAHGAGLPRSSSSMVSSSSLDSLSSLIPRQPTEPIRRAESEPPAEATSGVAQPRQQQPAQSNVVTHGRSEQGPNYAQMDIETLQDIARMYGLRTNTPKRLLVHQLTQIWEQMHTGQLSSSNEGPPRVQTNIEPLYRDLRAYIRSNTGIFDDVLCYKVLDFERVYQAINASVQCDRWMLRKFFDSEGIVYTAAFDRSKHRGHA